MNYSQDGKGYGGKWCSAQEWYSYAPKAKTVPSHKNEPAENPEDHGAKPEDSTNSFLRNDVHQQEDKPAKNPDHGAKEPGFFFTKAGDATFRNPEKWQEAAPPEEFAERGRAPPAEDPRPQEPVLEKPAAAPNCIKNTGEKAPQPAPVGTTTEIIPPERASSEEAPPKAGSSVTAAKDGKHQNSPVLARALLWAADGQVCSHINVGGGAVRVEQEQHVVWVSMSCGMGTSTMMPVYGLISLSSFSSGLVLYVFSTWVLTTRVTTRGPGEL